MAGQRLQPAFQLPSKSFNQFHECIAEPPCLLFDRTSETPIQRRVVAVDFVSSTFAIISCHCILSLCRLFLEDNQGTVFPLLSILEDRARQTCPCFLSVNALRPCNSFLRREVSARSCNSPSTHQHGLLHGRRSWAEPSALKSVFNTSGTSKLSKSPNRDPGTSLHLLPRSLR